MRFFGHLRSLSGVLWDPFFFAGSWHGRTHLARVTVFRLPPWPSMRMIPTPRQWRCISSAGCSSAGPGCRRRAAFPSSGFRRVRSGSPPSGLGELRCSRFARFFVGERVEPDFFGFRVLDDFQRRQRGDPVEGFPGADDFRAGRADGVRCLHGGGVVKVDRGQWAVAAERFSAAGWVVHQFQRLAAMGALVADQFLAPRAAYFHHCTGPFGVNSESR